ncbi:MAG: hypothetical protein RLO18_02495, partial [Gimesia chilikensis]
FVLNPLSTKPAKGDYLSVMQEQLSQLAQFLKSNQPVSADEKNPKSLVYLCFETVRILPFSEVSGLVNPKTDGIGHQNLIGPITTTAAFILNFCFRFAGFRVEFS